MNARRQKPLWYAATALAAPGALCFGVRGMRFSGALLWGAALGLAACAVLDALAAEKPWARRCRNALVALFCGGFALFLVLEALVISGARSDAAGHDVSCVIILGAGVDGTEPSLSLKTRLDAALDFLADKPDVPIVVSGRRGMGETISEAECMYRYLTARGVAPERVWREERSSSTRENFEFSIDLMAERGIDPTADFAFVTNDYHVYRAKRLAGVPWARGVAARLPRGAYYDVLEANYFVREAFALAKEYWLRMVWGR